jgi:hypothetical protein
LRLTALTFITSRLAVFLQLKASPFRTGKAFKLLFATSVVGARVPATEPIRVRKETKEELNRLKVHPRETYDDVITRLIEEYKRCKGVQG